METYLTILLIGIAKFSTLGLLNTSVPMCTYKTSDTVTIAQSQKAITFQKGEKFCRIPLVFSGNSPLKTNIKSLLVFEQVTVDPLPEGVYEIYLVNNSKNEEKVFSAKSRDFINVLDLYNLSDKPIVINISNSIQQLGLQNKSLSELSVVIFFNGNMLPDKRKVRHNSKLSIGRIRLVQEG